MSKLGTAKTLKSLSWQWRSRMKEVLQYAQTRRRLASKETRNCNTFLPIQSPFSSLGFDCSSS